MEVRPFVLPFHRYQVHQCAVDGPCSTWSIEGQLTRASQAYKRPLPKFEQTPPSSSKEQAILERSPGTDVAY
ncbi:hypothetical protein AOLI_G00182890 [Acnodon oligacanthus]